MEPMKLICPREVKLNRRISLRTNDTIEYFENGRFKHMTWSRQAPWSTTYRLRFEATIMPISNNVYYVSRMAKNEINLS